MFRRHTIYPFLLLSFLCGCFDTNTTVTGCRSMSTIGEYGLVDFDLDYGEARSYAAVAGRTWAVGAQTGLTLRDVESGWPLLGLRLESSDVDVLQVEQDPADSSRATFRVVGPGHAYLQVLAGGKLYDRVELAARWPESILTVTAVDGYLHRTHGWIGDGLGEPGVVLATGRSCILLFGLGNGDFQRLDGSFDLQVEAAETDSLSVEFLGVQFLDGWSLHSYRVSGIETSQTRIGLQTGRFSEDFPVRVEDDPEVHRLQIDVHGSAYSDPEITEQRSAGTVGTQCGPVVPRAHDAAGWPIQGLTYQFDHSGVPVEFELAAEGEIAYFRPLEAGELTLAVGHDSGVDPLEAVSTYHISR